MTNQKFNPKYTYVVHATEASRRERYNGCCSRQHLRQMLRKEAVAGIRTQYSKEEHSLVRTMGIAKSKLEYRRLRGLNER